MFVGHCGVSFAAKSIEKNIPLWLLFIAVQFVDVLWAILVLAGIEKVTITPGITATNPLDSITCPTLTASSALCVGQVSGLSLTN